MKSYVYDAGALSLLLIGDSRLKGFVAEVSRGQASAHTNAVNLSELYYKTGQKLGVETAETWFHRILNSNLHVEGADAELAREAGAYKIRYRGSLSIADCFAAAETIRRKGTLLTTDADLKLVKEIDARFLKA
jgi:predicted nucleic acid-binding protein